MDLNTLRKEFVSDLLPFYPEEEIKAFFYILTEAYLDLSRAQVSLHLKDEVQEKKIEQFRLAIKGLKSQRPIQYILGETEFYGCTFKVNPSVLIPRPETEELVDWIIKDHRSDEIKTGLKILDIGTGSGCIAISLAKHIKKAFVTAVDVSGNALDIASHNAEMNKVKIFFKEMDILNTHYLEEDYDIIVSNPPYVRNLEKKEMKPNVLDYEPEIALFVEDRNPLLFYQKITELASNHLIHRGKLYFEINQYLGADTLNLLKTSSFHQIELRKDIYNNDRMLRGVR